MDLTPACQEDHHNDCDGSLPERVNYHWWCACPCHPEQQPTTKDEVLAHAVWREQRSLLFDAFMETITVEAYGTVTNPPEEPT